MNLAQPAPGYPSFPGYKKGSPTPYPGGGGGNQGQAGSGPLDYP